MSGTSRSRCLPPLVAGPVVAAVVAGTMLIATPDRPDEAPPLGAALSESDRRALDASPPARGGPAAAVDPGVDLTDPATVARAYLVAAHGAVPEDAGRTHLRAAGYAVPGTPAATVGVVVVDPPGPGSRRVAEVTALDLAAADRGDRRRGYLAAVLTRVGGQADVVLERYVVLARQPDGRWLVAAESAATPDVSAGED
ncbi:MAG TPA: hypothetical protein VM367_04530 [Pseudonocardia sp.]|nr:hypothetical protein [Pseudonocardia sp.]